MAAKKPTTKHARGAIQVAIDLPAKIVRRLRVAAVTQRNDDKDPRTQTDIVAEALDDWLTERHF